MRLALAVGIVAFLITTAYLLQREPEQIVLDRAALLEPGELAFIAEYHGYLVDDHQIDYRVVTTSEDGSILEQAVALYESLGVGSRSEAGRGLLLLINPVLDQVRLEVGFTLEGIYPDAFVAYIEDRQMVPFFADDRIADGILATTELIVDRAQRQVELGGIDPSEAWLAGSGGGGAQTDARLGAGNQPAAITARQREGLNLATVSPEATLAAYFRVMNERDSNPLLTLYTAETQAMLAGRTVTPAQMDTLMRAYRDCSPEPARYDGSGRLAVIRYPAGQRQCAPWFFRQSGNRWQLDLAILNSAIRFGRSNAWRRSEQGFGIYAFAFRDWTFDQNGFPRE